MANIRREDQTVNSSLSIFDERAVQSDLHSWRIVDYDTRTADNAGPIEFIVPGSGEEYIDMNKIDINIKFKFLHADGTDIETADLAGINNLPIVTLFRDVSLSVANVQIEGGQQDYSYKAYLQTVMQFQRASQNTHMRALGWIKDQHGKFDSQTNIGWVKKQALIAESRVNCMVLFI